MTTVVRLTRLALFSLDPRYTPLNSSYHPTSLQHHSTSYNLPLTFQPTPYPTSPITIAIMPRAPSKTNRTPNKRAQPYPSSSPVSDDSEIKPSDVGDDTKPQTKSTGKKGRGTAWSGEDLQQLFDFALNRNGRDWGEAVPGRTANQARQTWG
jgi:hypothetical protein